MTISNLLTITPTHCDPLNVSWQQLTRYSGGKDVVALFALR